MRFATISAGLTLAFVLALSFVALAEQRAVTETGKEVILKDDGTWTYVGATPKREAISTNDKLFTKPGDASFQVRSLVNRTSIWINPRKWSFEKGQATEATEYSFELKGADVYAMVINEAIEIPVSSLLNIALENARSAASDARLIHAEYRSVNGLKVLHARMDGTLQGIKFSYLSYYYSDASGTTQLVAYTGRTLVDRYEKDILELLNGLVRQGS